MKSKHVITFCSCERGVNPRPGSLWCFYFVNYFKQIVWWIFFPNIRHFYQVPHIVLKCSVWQRWKNREAVSSLTMKWSIMSYWYVKDKCTRSLLIIFSVTFSLTQGKSDRSLIVLLLYSPFCPHIVDIIECGLILHVRHTLYITYVLLSVLVVIYWYWLIECVMTMDDVVLQFVYAASVRDSLPHMQRSLMGPVRAF